MLAELNLSHNQMSKLPDELADLTELTRLDLSHNTFVTLPGSVFRMPKLALLSAHHNSILGKTTPHSLLLALHRVPNNRVSHYSLS